jgi:hypothetical protein
MKEKLRFLGLDVHAETIAVAIVEPDGEVRSLGTIPNRGESIRKIVVFDINCRRYFDIICRAFGECRGPVIN